MLSIWKKSSLLTAALLVGGLWTDGAEARFFRPGLVPNYDAAVGDCSLCHVTAGGGTARNPFGQAVEALVTPNGQEVFWGPELAALDSDGDGATNGEELGDPDGTWTADDPAPGDPALITHPGDPDSTPPAPEPTAVEASSWARIKAFVDDLAQ